MDLTAIKKYPSQISTAFKRFPLASAFAIFASVAFIYDIKCSNSPFTNRLEHWLLIYPIAAMLISLAVSLVQESRQSFSKIPQIVASAIWIAISVALTFYFPKDSNDHNQIYVGTTYFLIYTTTFLSIFIAPFFKQKDENGFWVFLTKSIKVFVISIVITYVLDTAVNLLLLGFFHLFDIRMPEKTFLYITVFCTCTVCPILIFSGLPSIDDCLQETPALNKFETSTNKFLFLPVLSLYIILLYAYIAKIIIQWEMPKGMVSYLVSASMLFMVLQVTLMHPKRINPKPSFEKKLLKILPAACIPLVILMSVGIFRRIADYGISESRYYVVAINIFFYAIIAILLTPKIICKSKYIAIIFCSIFLILTNGPLSAINVTHRVWMKSIKVALAEEGYNKFPLSEEDSQKFIDQLKAKKSPQTETVISRIKSRNIKFDKELAQYITTNNINFHTNNYDKIEPISILIAFIHAPKDNYLDIPQNVSKVSYFYKTFRQEDYEFRNDTLFFQLSPKKLDKTFKFFITKEALEQKNVRILETEGAKIGVEKLDINIIKDDKKESYFNLRGFLFLE